MKRRDEIDRLHGKVLNFLGNDDGSTDNPHLSFECGVLAALDWILGHDSIYSEIVEEDLTALEPMDVTDPDWIKEQDMRITAMRRMAWDVWAALDHGLWGDAEEHFSECISENDEFPAELLPYVIEARDQLLKEFERRSRS